MNIDTAYNLELVPDDFSDDEHTKLDAHLKLIPLTEDTFAEFGSMLLVKIADQLGNRAIKRYTSLPQCVALLKDHPELRKCLLDGAKHGYSLVRRLKILRESNAAPNTSADITLEGKTSRAAREAWVREYCGDYHQVLLNNINSMKRSVDHVNCVSLIQSSGAGKSRMVDEVSKLVFSIPFNLRNPDENRYGAFPFEDTIVWKYLCTSQIMDISSVEQEENRSALFFQLLFAEVGAEVRNAFGESTGTSTSPKEFAQWWYTHLSGLNNRRELYERIVDNCKTQLSGPPPSPSAEPRKSDKLKDNLIGLLATLGEYCAFEPGKVKILLYFDEAHELGRKIPGSKKTLYDTLWSSLAKFNDDSVFTLFLSTQSSISLLAPSALGARSLRQRNENVLWGPITETPFDCHPSFPLRPGLCLKDVQKLEFLTRFGRPLFWSMLGRKNNPKLLEKMLELARQKLLFNHNIFNTTHSEIDDIAKSAILDVLITIDYEPRRMEAHQREMEMVASHMRTAFSIPDHRLYTRSGYPSEPFLAEAASRQVHHYQTADPGKGRFSMVQVLTKDLQHGLIDLGQKGEVCMRLLLREAYMNAIVAEQRVESGTCPNFSAGCMFLGFLKALFAERFHDQILDCEPVNDTTSPRTLRATFQNAVVRFTHFAKAADRSLISTRGMLMGFLRGAAIIGYNTQESIDIAIPILLDKSKKIEEASMSAFFIQVKRRRRPGSVNAYLIDAQKLNFFPKGPTEDVRSYVTLVAELGATKPLKDDVNVDVDHAGRRTSARRPPPRVHPRFAIRAYKCSVDTWGTIHPDDKHHYDQLLCLDELLADHPRQDEESLGLTRRLLPFWDLGPGWLGDNESHEDDEVDGDDEDDEDDKEDQVDEEDGDEPMEL